MDNNGSPLNSAPVGLARAQRPDGSWVVFAYIKIDDTVYAGAGEDIPSALSDAMEQAFPKKRVELAPGFGDNLVLEDIPILGDDDD